MCPWSLAGLGQQFCLGRVTGQCTFLTRFLNCECQELRQRPTTEQVRVARAQARVARAMAAGQQAMAVKKILFLILCMESASFIVKNQPKTLKIDYLKSINNEILHIGLISFF